MMRKILGVCLVVALGVTCFLAGSLAFKGSGDRQNLQMRERMSRMNPLNAIQPEALAAGCLIADGFALYAFMDKCNGRCDSHPNFNQEMAKYACKEGCTALYMYATGQWK